jgi:hypothetical protein
LIRFDKDSQQENVNVILQQWSSVKERLHHGHELKNKEVHSYMLEAILLYNKLLVEASGTDGFDANDLNKYEVLPLNGVERYKFIVMHPSHYAAYRQLNELFEETKKKIARLRIQYK